MFLVQDLDYIERIAFASRKNIADSICVFNKTIVTEAMEEIEKNDIEICVFSEEYENSFDKTSSCCFIKLCNINTVQENEIFKYQPFNILIEEVITIYNSYIEKKNKEIIKFNNCKTIVFSSPTGGSGTSSIAAAYVYNLALNYNVLYINAEVMGVEDAYFNIIGKNIDQTIEISPESEGRVIDEHIVIYKRREYSKLLEQINSIKTKGLFDYIVVDMTFIINEDTIEVFKNAEKIIFVSDGLFLSYKKNSEAIELLKEREVDINRIGLYYNKISSHKYFLKNENIENYGQANRIEGITHTAIINELIHALEFNKI